MSGRPFKERSDGVLLHVKLTSNARKDEVLGIIEGPNGPLIAAKVRAIADKGKANKALVALMSQSLGVAKTTIELKSGSKSRLKTLAVSGDSHELVMKLMSVLD